jgi:hypothetical protein
MRLNQAKKLKKGDRIGFRCPGQTNPIPLVVVSVREDVFEGDPVVWVKASDPKNRVVEYNHKILREVR